MSPFRSSVGLPDYIAAALCYLFPFAGGIIFLALEKRSRFVLFHSLQSLLAYGALMVGHVLAGLLPFIGALVATLCFLLGFAVWLVMTYHALQGHWQKLPWAGDIAERQLRRL
ncbi:membrane protein [Paenibacillus stellifer]|uniref:Membrane protein n=1 Tax=Paenibacillus stellifer TaxID=169760 RepID=A0A089LQ34_9BACL|nr:membrane protein [Paenibacillus stellifer]AIQ62215.1 membrane protein [Paenibacillus stellifer]